MLDFTARRLFAAVPTLLILVTVAFFMMRIAPGGPFDGERPLPAETRANLERLYHFDEPLPRQYVRYVGAVLRGDLGPSFQYRDWTVNELLAQGFAVSAPLGAAAMALALVAGFAAGAYAALRRGSWRDHAVMGAAIAGISVPNFVLAPLLILVFAVGVGWLPAGGWGDARHWVLPVIVLALPPLATVARLTRAAMADALGSGFVRTAVANGLPARSVLLRHALRPALLPVVSYAGPATAAILAGSLVVEQVFGLPGVGRHFIQGALNRDYTLVMGVVLVYGALIVVMNLLVDLAYAWLDPRVRQ